MNLHVVTKGHATAIEGPPAARLLEAPGDVVDLVGVCFEHKTQNVLLYAENLTERFFDLSSGEAGAILQTFRNYRIKVAVVAKKYNSAQRHCVVWNGKVPRVWPRTVHARVASAGLRLAEHAGRRLGTRSIPHHEPFACSNG